MHNWKDEINKREYEAEQRQRQQLTEVAAILGFIGVMVVVTGVCWVYLQWGEMWNYQIRCQQRLNMLFSTHISGWIF